MRTRSPGFRSSPELMNCCNSVGLPSMGRIVVHPLTAMMSRQAVNHLMGYLDGKAFCSNSYNLSSLRPAPRYLVVFYIDIGPEVDKKGWSQGVVAQAGVLYCQAVYRFSRSRVAGVAPDAILNVSGRDCRIDADPFGGPKGRI